MKDTLEKIKSLLSKTKTNLYAEMKLDDGRVVATEDEQFMIGSKVMVVGDDGETSPLEAGSYTMSDGAKLTIDADSKITDLGEDKEAEDVEAKKKKEYAEDDESPAEEADWAKSYEEMKDKVDNLIDAVADLKRDKVGGDDSEEVEMTEETTEPSTNPKTITTKEVVEFTAEEVAAIKAENEKLKTELAESPADAPINTNKFSAERPVLTKKEYNKLSRQERFLYNLNK